MDTDYDIIILGTGWYSCHILSILKDKYKILTIDKNSDIFGSSSYYNQNRLHLGYHYARNYPTRNLCKEKYDRFLSKYKECVDNINDNYYVISNESIICNETYKSIFNHEGFSFEEENRNDIFSNIQGLPIKVNEKVINSEKAKNMMKERLLGCNFLFNTYVNSVEYYESYIQINGKYRCKLLLDCTYNQLQLDNNNYKYEMTLSLLYEKKEDFGAVTVVDGNFCSLYPRDGNIYTLTDVELTPVYTSNNFNDVEKYNITDNQIEETRSKMEDKMRHYFPSFLHKFRYISYFLSYKTKLISGSDSRDITISKINNRTISVNCGKIYGIFEWESYILEFLSTFEWN